MSNAESKRYYAQRHGRGPKAGPLPIESIRRLVFSVWDKLQEDGYFQQAMGYWCVDSRERDGWEPGSLGEDVGAHFLRALMLEDVWPYRGNEIRYDADTLYSMVEVLHDLVSAPIEGHYHSFNNCGWHYNQFDQAAGHERYRRDINDVLALAAPPHAMDENGLVITLGPEEFRAMLDADVPPGTDETLVTSRMQAAVARFRRYGATLDDKRHAVRDLADVLEAIRADVKTEMLSADEKALFHMANGFAVRHNNREQKGDYDRVTWLTWAFYVYLATIHAVLRVAQHQRA